MGCSLSCMQMQMKMEMASPPKLKSIRIVCLNGLVEEIEYPITAAEVTGKQAAANHFLFTQSQLLTAPLKQDVQLEPGRVYFLLPDMSPADLAPLARKLASIAKSKSNITVTADSSALQNSCRKSRSWKPILSTIRERSFNRRSESDLQAEEAN